MEQRIVIAGGGFVGLRLARLLSRRLKKTAKIILVDKNDRFIFSPWLIDALGGKKDAPDISEAYQSVALRDGFEFIHAEATEVNRNAKVLEIRKLDGTKERVGYDVLVVCLGAKITFYGIPGAETNAFSLKTMTHVEKLHAKAKELVNQARTATPEERKKLLHFMVVGGGPSGIEALFAFKQYVECHLCCDAAALANDVRFTLIEGAPNPLNGFRPTIRNGTRKELERQGVTVKTDMRCTSIEPGVIWVGRESLEGGLVLWCGGVQPNDLFFSPEIARDQKNNLKADDVLHLDQDIYGGGDGVLTLDVTGKPAARTAQIAMQEADLLARNIARQVKGLEPKPARPRLLGSLIILGDTGYIDTPWFAIKTFFSIPLRDLFYRFRFWQMTGR